MLAGMVEGVLVVDAEQRVVLANPRVRELLGFRGELRRAPALEARARHRASQEALARGRRSQAIP